MKLSVTNVVNDKLISKLNYNQKKHLLQILFHELNRGNNDAQEKIFKILDSLPIKNSKYLAEAYSSDLKGEFAKEFQTEYLLKYSTKKELVDKLIEINPRILDFNRIVEAIIPTFNKAEMLGLLEACKYKKGVINLVLSNYKGNIGIDTFKSIYEKGNYLVFDKLAYDDQIKVATDYDYRDDNLVSRIKNLKEEDRLHIELNQLKSKITPLSEESLIKYINKYNPDPYNLSLAMEVTKDLNLEEFINKLDKSSRIYSRVYFELINEKLDKVKKSEKRKYLLDLPINVIDDNFSLIEKDLKLLDKEELSHKLAGKTIKNYFFAKYILDNFAKEELKENGVKISGANAIEFDVMELMDENLNDDDKITITHQLSNLLFRNKGNLEHKELLKDLLISGVTPRFRDYDGIFGFEDIIDILNHRGDFIEYIDIISYGEKELLQLKEYGKNNERYIDLVLHYKKFSLDKKDDFTDLQLSLLANAKVANRYSVESFVNIDVIKELINRKDKDALLNVLKYYSPQEIMDKGLEKDILVTIDNSGGLLELYNSINEVNYAKLKEINLDKYKQLMNKELYDVAVKSIEFWVASSKRDFLEKISKINDHKDLLLKMKNNNPLIMHYMNYNLLGVLNDKSLEYLSRYEEMKVLYFRSASDDSFKELIGNVVNRILETRKYPDELIEQCLLSSSKLNKDKIESLLKEDVDKVIYLMSKDSIALRANINEYEIYEEEYCNDILDSSDNLEECLEAFFRAKMKMNLEEAKRLVKVYGSEIDKLSVGSYEDEKIVKSLQTLKQIEKILQVNNKAQLLKIYNASGSNRNYSFSLLLEENLKRAFNTTIVSGLYTPKNDDLKEANIYEVDGDFKILISVIGAYVANKDSLDNPRDNWNDKERLVNHGICASLISNNNLSSAPQRGNLIYGFNSLEDTSLLTMAPYDLYSSSNSVKVSSRYDPKYMTGDGLIDSTRQGHSELVIERRANNSNSKRQPDYIVAFDVVKDIDLKASKEFNIPIVLINTEKIAYRESEKLAYLYKDILRDPTPDKIEELIKQYHNNYAGLVVNNPKLNDKYFNPKKFEGALNNLLDSLISLEEGDKKESLIEAFDKALNDEDEKRAFVHKSYYPFSFSKLHDKIDNIKKDNPIKDFFDKLKDVFTRNSK